MPYPRAEKPNLPPLRPGEWRTQDGNVILIAEMGDSHLENTLNYLVKNVHTQRTWALQRIEKCAAVVTLPGTREALEAEAERIRVMPAVELLMAHNEKFAEMYQEATRRNLGVANVVMRRIIEGSDRRLK